MNIVLNASSSMKSTSKVDITQLMTATMKYGENIGTVILTKYIYEIQAWDLLKHLIAIPL